MAIKRSILLKVVDYAVIAVITFIIGAALDAWKVYPIPRGCDALSHLAKLQFVIWHWPHVRWNHLWGSGMPLFRWYPPLFYYITVALSRVTPLDVAKAIDLVIFFSFWLTAVGAYMFVWELVEDRKLSILAAAIALSIPTLWRLRVVGALMARIPSAAFYTLSLYAAMRYVKNGRDVDLVLASLIASISTLFHPSFGATSLISLFTLCIFFIDNIGDKIKAFVKIILTMFLFTAWFTIPFVTPLPTVELVKKAPLKYFIIPFTQLPTSAEGGYPNPIITPMTIALLIVTLIKRKTFDRMGRIVPWALVTTVLLFVFATQKLDPETAMTSITVTLTPASAYLIKLLSGGKRKLSTVVVSMLIALVLAVQLFTAPGGVMTLGDKICNFLGSGEEPYRSIRNCLTIPDSDYVYRVEVAGAYGDVGQWFNYVYDVPQTREYYGQGLTKPEFYGLYSLVYYEVNEYNKTNFILDWWGIKWILARDDVYIEGSNITHYDKFIQRPDLYELDGHFDHYHEFTFRHATPIVVASNAISLLIIGDENAYSDTFTALMYSNSNSLYVVVIRGSQYIDDYDVEDLLEYDVVLIRGYNWHDRVRAWSILMAYVMNGGNLVIETGYSPDSSSTFIPAPCPVESTHASGFGSTWNLTYVRNEITEGIRFDLFSPPLYGESPWGISYSDNESVRDWATPILYEEGYPVIAIGEYSGGRVVWCGMNLPYHVCCYRNYWESLLWFRLIAWASGRSEFGMVSYDFERPSPEKVVVHVYEPARGILFKEYTFKNWRAVLVDGAGRKFKLDIHEAGPGFMYVTIPDGVQYPVEVTFKYVLSWDELLGYALSIPTYLWAAVYLIRGLRRREGGGDGGVR